MLYGVGLRVPRLSCGVWGSGIGVWGEGSGLPVSGAGFKVHGSGFRGGGLGKEIQCLVFSIVLSV